MEMNFTDDDLARMKAQIEKNDPIDNWTSVDNMKALIRRLECAEHALSSYLSLLGGQHWTTEYKAWRRAKGEEEAGR